MSSSRTYAEENLLKPDESFALDIKRMLTGRIDNLRDVFRYNTYRVQRRESVAEHSYFTSLYTYLVSIWVMENNPELRLDIGRAVVKALIHDLEEAVTADVPRRVKHDNPDLKTALEAAGRYGVRDIGVSISGQKMAEYLLNDWRSSKNATVSGRIVTFADFLSVLGYLIQEHQAGNRVEAVFADIHKYSEMFHADEYLFIRPLVDQTDDLIGRYFI